MGTKLRNTAIFSISIRHSVIHNIPKFWKLSGRCLFKIKKRLKHYGTGFVCYQPFALKKLWPDYNAELDIPNHIRRCLQPVLSGEFCTSLVEFRGGGRLGRFLVRDGLPPCGQRWCNLLGIHHTREPWTLGGRVQTAQKCHLHVP